MRFVYAILAPRRRAIKIGCSCCPAARLSALKAERKEPLRLLAQAWGDFGTERRLHQKLSAHAIGREWFRANDDVMGIVQGMKARGDKQTVANEKGRWLLRREAAQSLGVTEHTVDSMVLRGKLRTKIMGGFEFVSRASVRRALSERAT